MGSVKVTVFGRVKPCPKKLANQDFRIRYGDNEDYVTFGSLRGSSGVKYYRFQKVFEEDSTQQEVFDVVAKPAIEKVLSGYNGTIFTYGQTGSGKTYTMTGDIEKWLNPGLIPRTIQEVFRVKSGNTVVSITYCEIYNEHVYDLIRMDRLESEIPQVSLLEDSSGITHFRNLSVHTVSTAYEALQLLLRGDANKMVAETASNAKSSRSHVIFSIALDIPHPSQEKLCLKPVLYLVDLAGSEKLSKCKSSMANPWETRYINLSLHYLEQVLVALRQPGRVHIPYRNSLMTALLRNSLGGNCVTSMIATFSLTVEDIEETVQTCRFAERIGLIKNDVKLNEIANPQKEIDLLKKEVATLKAQLKLLGQEQKSEELSEEDKEVCSEVIQKYIQSNDCLELPLNDVRKMEYCFQLMREYLKRKELFEQEKKKHEKDIKSLRRSIQSQNNPPSQNDFHLESAKLITRKPVSNGENIWRRKRNPIEIPKINITYKRWKSTEELTEDENLSTKKVTMKTKRSAEMNEDATEHPKHFLKETSNENPALREPKSEETFILAGCFLKDRNPDILSKVDCSRGIYCSGEEFNNFPSRNLRKINGADPNSSRTKKRSVSPTSSGTSAGSGEKVLFATLKKLISVGVQMEGKEEHQQENETEFVSKNYSNYDFENTSEFQREFDRESSTSTESSVFSERRLPLTGDLEVDEEILRFYKTRYELFRSE